MTARFRAVVGEGKPVTAMVHFGALPGAPLHDAERGHEGLFEDPARDPDGLQAAGFDAVTFGNENDRPHEFAVAPASTATIAYLIGRLRLQPTLAFGVDELRGSRPMSTMALAAATGASCVREDFTGRTYASDLGTWSADAGRALRCRVRLGPADLALPCNVSAEFGYSLDRMPLADRARAAVFSSVPDAVLVSGQITATAAEMSDLEVGKAALPGAPVLANKDVRHATVADVLRVADGCIAGSSLKVDGDTCNPVEPDRAADFMGRVRAARGA